jgi:hypothetical protein
MEDLATRSNVVKLKKRPFLVGAPAPVLKKHPGFSKHARQLYVTLRALADGKTGELRIRERWLKATVFDSAAEMCKRVRLRAMRELIAAGLVTTERPRIWCTIGGPTRAVAGPSRYTVYREPAPKISQKAKDSSKVHFQNGSRNAPASLIRNTFYGGT